MVGWAKVALLEKRSPKQATHRVTNSDYFLEAGYASRATNFHLRYGYIGGLPRRKGFLCSESCGAVLKAVPEDGYALIDVHKSEPQKDTSYVRQMRVGQRATDTTWPPCFTGPYNTLRRRHVLTRWLQCISGACTLPS